EPSTLSHLASSQFRKRLPSMSVQGSSGESRFYFVAENSPGSRNPASFTLSDWWWPATYSNRDYVEVRGLMSYREGRNAFLHARRFTLRQCFLTARNRKSAYRALQSQAAGHLYDYSAACSFFSGIVTASKRFATMSLRLARTR